jgi:hypothetical protein
VPHLPQQYGAFFEDFLPFVPVSSQPIPEP